MRPRHDRRLLLVLVVLVTALCLWVSAAAAAAVGGAADEAPAAADPSAPRGIERPADPVPSRYIVTLKESTGEVEAAADALAADVHGEVVDVYTHALSGFSVRMSEADARELSRDPSVASVAQDGYVHADAVQLGAPWGLDRIDDRDLPVDGSYLFNADGSGVTAYILDTAVRTTHTEFEGRASVAPFDAINDGHASDPACQVHGTNVAGIIGGKTYGVAKHVSLVSVRVLGCNGTGSFSQLIAGIDWVTAHRVAPAVANMSVGGDGYSPVDNAVTNSIAAGVTYVTSAGNQSSDACDYSPARVPSALTVAASDPSDARASFSNFGTCVDLFAPGTNISSAGATSDEAAFMGSGTSDSAPHVAGTAALFLQRNPTATPAQVASGILDNATANHVSGGGSTPNRLLYSAFVGGPAGTLPVQRIFGTDAVGTAIAVSQAAFGPGSAGAVVIARSDHFADALAGGPFSAAKNAPLLITPGAGLSTTIDPRVLAEIQRVLTPGKTVYLLGGPLALDPNIDGALQSAGYSVVRVQGDNQFATAVAIAHALGPVATVFEATGLHFADALSAVPAAIQAGGAILLTNGSTQAAETAAYLAERTGVTRYAIGGPLAAAGADPGAEAVYGQDLFDTSAAVASRFFGVTPATFGAASGANFPDALSGGVFMGMPGHFGPMLLVSPTQPLPGAIEAYLAQANGMTLGFLFGGPLAVDDAVADALAAAGS